jgi:hypothetical protein
MAVNRGLQKDLADTLQRTDKEGIHSDKRAGMGCFDVAFAEFRAEAFQHAGLFLGERDGPLSGCLFQPQQPFVLGQ